MMRDDYAHAVSCALRTLSRDLPGYRASLRETLMELTTPAADGKYLWQSFSWRVGDQTRTAKFSTFEAYLKEWSRFTLDDLRKLFADDDDVITRLGFVTRKKTGKRATKDGPTRKAGNSKTRTLMRLQRDNPELHQQVLDGKMSPNKAAIKAGWRPPMWSAPQDIDKLTAALERRYPGKFKRC